MQTESNATQHAANQLSFAAKYCNRLHKKNIWFTPNIWGKPYATEKSLTDFCISMNSLIFIKKIF